MNFYHGSTRRHKVGDMLVAVERPTEFSDRKSKDGVYVERFVEDHRPDTEVSRLKSIFLVADPKCVNIAGGAEDFVYMVEPVGYTSKCHFGWFYELLGVGKLRGNKLASGYAMNYWDGLRNVKEHRHTAWEWLAESVVVLRRV